MATLKRYISLISFNKKEYEELKSSIRISNYQVLRSLLFISSFLFLLLFVASFFLKTPIAQKNQVIYLIFLNIFLVLYFLTGIIAKKFPVMVMPFVYCFVITCQAFGIIIGIFKQSELPAITFMVLQFVMPILFVDRPWRMTLLYVICAVVFIDFDYCVKPVEIFYLDVTNLTAFFLLANICSRYFINLKIKGQKMVKTVENERDTDSVTGVLTKAAFLREIERLLSIDSSKGVFLMIDIDDFKHFNDEYGHDTGDKVLRVLGECMRDSFRQSDLLGRFGGDEFFIFIPSTNDTDVALYRAKTMQVRLENGFSLPGVNTPVTLSVGISNCRGLGETYDSLFKRADEAIYEAKDQGKNTIVVK